MNATTNDLQAAIAALVAEHGVSDVLRAISTALEGQAEQHDTEGDDWYVAAGDDDYAWQHTCANLEYDHATDLRGWAEQLDSEADKLDDERVDLERRIEAAQE